MNTDRRHPYANPDSKIYWEAANSGILLIRGCKACDAKHFLPRHHCPKCWSPDLAWIKASGVGSVYSFSIIHRAPDEAFLTKVPFVIALVDLIEGPRMLANIIGIGSLETSVGDEVKVTFEKMDFGYKLPQFLLSKFTLNAIV